MSRETLGKFGENYAAGYLTRHGYHIVERNVRFPEGEIDIVAREGSEWVFIEVKCRRTPTYGSPESSITPRRFLHLAKAVESYLAHRCEDTSAHRVDVVAIEVDGAGKVTRCEVMRAVEAPSW